MEEELSKRLDQMDEQLQSIQKSVSWIKKYLLIQAVISILMIILPLIAAAILVPMILSAMQSFMPSQLFNGSFLQ